MSSVMEIKIREHEACVAEKRCPLKEKSSGPASCNSGKANAYPCSKVDMLSFVSLADMGTTGDGNDIWGWTDPKTGKEIAIMGLFDGTAFVDVSNPSSPIVLGNLPTHTVGSMWRDVKVYSNHAYI